MTIASDSGIGDRVIVHRVYGSDFVATVTGWRRVGTFDGRGYDEYLVMDEAGEVFVATSA